MFVAVHSNEHVSAVIILIKKMSSFSDFLLSLWGIFGLKMFVKKASPNKCQSVKVSGSGWLEFSRSGSNMKPADRFDDDDRSWWSLRHGYVLKEAWFLQCSWSDFHVKPFVYCVPLPGRLRDVTSSFLLVSWCVEQQNNTKPFYAMFFSLIAHRTTGIYLAIILESNLF